jgi:hypothetical protein
MLVSCFPYSSTLKIKAICSSETRLFIFISLSCVMSQNKAAPYLKRLVAGLPPRRTGFEPGSGQVGFVVDKVALGQVFSEYFGFPCQSSFHQILHHYNHPGRSTCRVDPVWTQPPHYANLKKCILLGMLCSCMEC